MVNMPLIFLACEPVTKLWNLTISGQCRGEPRDYVFAFLGGEFFTQFCLLEGNRVVVLIRTDCPVLLSMGHGNGLFACTVSGGDCVQPPRTLQAQTISLSPNGTGSLYGIMHSYKPPFNSTTLNESATDSDPTYDSLRQKKNRRLRVFEISQHRCPCELHNEHPSMLSVPRPTKTSILRTGNVNRLPLATSVAPIQSSVSKSQRRTHAFAPSVPVDVVNAWHSSQVSRFFDSWQLGVDLFGSGGKKTAT